MKILKMEYKKVLPPAGELPLSRMKQGLQQKHLHLKLIRGAILLPGKEKYINNPHKIETTDQQLYNVESLKQTVQISKIPLHGMKGKAFVQTIHHGKVHQRLEL